MAALTPPVLDCLRCAARDGMGNASFAPLRAGRLRKVDDLSRNFVSRFTIT
jgi:hypothetical protein